MKTMNKIFLVVLALVMMLSMATTAFAAETGTISIKNAANGVTYTFYRVFDMENSEDLIYKTNAKWADFVGENGAGIGYVSVNGNGTVRAANLNTEADAKAFAALVVNAGIAEDLAVTAGTNTDNATFDASTGTLTITGMEHGYYVVKSSRGTIFTVDTLNTDTLEIAEKNEHLPQFKKEVQEDSTNAYGETNDAEIGQTMKFKLTITASAGQDAYSIADTMTNMEFIAVESVTINPDSDNKTVTDSTVTSADGTFSITLSNATRQSLKDNDVVEIIYTAMLTAGAKIEGDGNQNAATFTYNADKTISDSTISYTFDVPVSKTDADGAALAGAGFTLYRADDSVVYVKAYGTDNEYVVVSADTADAQAEIVTDSTGAFTVKGLDNDDADKYTLKETTVPDGYQQASEKSFNVTDDVAITVVNELVSELPETGGIGTTVIYVIGGLMVLAAISLFVSKKRTA